MIDEKYSSIMSKDIEDSLRSILNSVTYSNNIKFYVGIVEDNNDPEKLGRCKIRVPSVYGTDISVTDIPWAIPDQTFIGSMVGSFVVPPIGSVVHVYFKDGVIYAPHYTNKVMNRNNLPDSRLSDYPDTIVFWESDAGGYLIYNRAKSRLELRHDSGVLIIMDSDGNIQIDNSAVKADIKLVCAGKIIIESGTVEIKNDTGAQVIPNPIGGAFCAIPNCLFTGAPHQGKIVNNCFVKSNDI